ncbi:MAG: hypothetical protein AB7G21_05935 [Dehalococcoidia bacterium]
MFQRRVWMALMLTAMAVITACGPGEVCESTLDREQREFNERQAAGGFPQPSPTTTSTPASTPSTPKAIASTTPSATPTPTAIGFDATPTPTAIGFGQPTPADFGTPTPAPDVLFGGTLGLGYDHPPFTAGNDSLGGASAGIVCGSLDAAIPWNGFSVTVAVSGGTGAPATVTGPVGGDGSFVIPFPINSYGPMNATVSAVKDGSGKALKGTVPPASLAVGGGPDVACTPK